MRSKAGFIPSGSFYMNDSFGSHAVQNLISLPESILGFCSIFCPKSVFDGRP